MLDLANMPVSLVEPSTTQARAIGVLLDRRGVRNVTVFDSGAALLTHAAGAPPALVISALYLPDMTAGELIERLRRAQGDDRTPFILISSETDAATLDPLRQSGLCAILPKPFSDAQLEAALRATVDYGDDTAPLELPDVPVERLRVLVVDDSGAARRFNRRLLQNLGLVDITEAENGRIASGLIGEARFDLVVTDYHMPEMDGRALAKYIRDESWQQDLPLLMITSEAQPERLAALRAAGVTAICGKPLDPADLRAKLQGMLGG